MNGTKYRIQIIKDDEVIAERDATPDMVIDFLAEMVTNNPHDAIPDEAPSADTHKSTVDRPDGKGDWMSRNLHMGKYPEPRLPG
jgi:hypothetical protein